MKALVINDDLADDLRWCSNVYRVQLPQRAYLHPWSFHFPVWRSLRKNWNESTSQDSSVGLHLQFPDLQKEMILHGRGLAEIEQ